MAGRALVVFAIVWAAGVGAQAGRGALAASKDRAPATTPPVSSETPLASFVTASTCMVCHNGLVTPAGEDVSIGSDWRASMMANSARDPYWQAAVRREIIDHPEAAAEIEDECSICHMPMSTYAARAAGLRGEVFAHLPAGQSRTAAGVLAADGVSCVVCHQITADKAGTPESFTGGFVVGTPAADGERALFGPFEVDAGRSVLMRSATGFVPTAASHIQSSDMCATCHTLYTNALGPGHEIVGRLPEQMPYLEWRHSAYRDAASCQTCHMPVVEDAMPVAGVLGVPREDVSRHSFRGGNFFMQRMLNRYRAELGVEATAQEMSAAIQRTIEHLETDAARLAIVSAERDGGRLVIDLEVRNLAGHKLPTAYPSRRAWLRVAVRDADGRLVFESGALEPNGRIAGNDNDLDPARFEPHYVEIGAPDQVQIYEPVLAGPGGTVTTGLLTATSYLKDNRLLPDGFDKATAPADVAVVGAARDDADFGAGADRTRYVVPVTASGAYTIEAELWYQPIGFRWADNLRGYDAFETRRFVRYYDAMADVSAVVLARTAAGIRD